MNFITGVLLKTAWEVIKGQLFSIGWKIIFERFVTRLVVWGLTKLKRMNTNDLLQGTVDDILAELQKQRLPQAKLEPDK